MRNISEKVVFFGSGPVAAESLTFLAAHFDVEAVVTKPKPPEHRGAFPVLDLSKKLGLTTQTVSNNTELSRLMATKPFKSRLGVIVDFGIIVNQDVIDYFPLGIVNSHFSLLPRWRGADPISFAILAGDLKTGVTLMLIEQALDTGKILVQKSLPIEPEDTTPSLTAKLIILSNQLLIKYLPAYIDGKVRPRVQPHPNRASYSRKLTKEDGLLDWFKPAEDSEREVRAFIDWPKSRTKLGESEVIVTKARVVDSKLKAGELQTSDNRIIIGTSKAALEILKLKPAGKNEMTAAEFLRGYGRSLT